MKDIETRQDLEELMISFYKIVMTDEVIGYFFTEVAPLNLGKHIPVIVDFWETVVFDKALYKGNVLQVHEQLHQLSAFRKEHFERWVKIFKKAVDEQFEGNNADKLKQRAESIAMVMKIKTIHGGMGLK